MLPEGDILESRPHIAMIGCDLLFTPTGLVNVANVHRLMDLTGWLWRVILPDENRVAELDKIEKIGLPIFDRVVVTQCSLEQLRKFVRECDVTCCHSELSAVHFAFHYLREADSPQKFLEAIETLGYSGIVFDSIQYSKLITR